MGDNEAEIGYLIGTEHWGMGYAPEAVNGIIRHELKSGELKAIWAGCFEGNKNSMRVLEKCGFEFVRTEKDKYLPLLDAYHTTHVMKIPIG
ncbi:MAG: GNAT family N-acetyltransferase [Lachnospiraceae bacterium]